MEIQSFAVSVGSTGGAGSAANSHAGAGQPPADLLSPAAEAVALSADPRAAAVAMSVLPVALSLSPVLPPARPAPMTQLAEVSRSAIAAARGDVLDPTDAKGAGPGNGAAALSRVLKPWGVAMLPATAEDRAARDGLRSAAAPSDDMASRAPGTLPQDARPS